MMLVAVMPGLTADPDLVRHIAETEFRRLGVDGRVVTGLDETADAVVALGRPVPHPAPVVWYDPADTGPVEVSPGSVHLYGRGLWGLTWAIRHAFHRLRHPAERVAYGPGDEQWGDLRLPPHHDGGPLPVAVLIHGGYWRSIWAADLMDALAVDLAERGYAAWNLEYRRPDRHGWQATVADVAAGLDRLTGLDFLDLDRVVVFGHSAGGQLALRAAADQARIALAVSLAGVVDLTEGERRRVGTGAVAHALGGPSADLPEVYAAADPMSRLPLGVRQLIVVGADDDLDLLDFNRRYAAGARAAGDDVTYLERPGDHFAVIDPASEIWVSTMTEVDALT
ncbi:alpha/beta hydrolase [Herbidospora galbida]|uniref:Alpha/beta hydrolase n=1 Tax=Herbidospora galbida TaxID=2575442 RepID=A0A4U3MPF0_9ACTN|nr:alpha/beta hydrolase [Herbidospora galbida]TKK91568.1 alpha/beta hydrolase [Herbidospora galbida]